MTALVEADVNANAAAIKTLLGTAKQQIGDANPGAAAVINSINQLLDAGSADGASVKALLGSVKMRLQ